MVRRVPALLRLVPLEHGEVGDPQQAEVAMLERAVTLGVLLSQREPQLSRSGINCIRLLASLHGIRGFRALCACDHDHQIFGVRLVPARESSQPLGERFLQPLDVLEDLGVFAIAEHAS